MFQVYVMNLLGSGWHQLFQNRSGNQFYPTRRIIDRVYVLAHEKDKCGTIYNQ